MLDKGVRALSDLIDGVPEYRSLAVRLRVSSLCVVVVAVAACAARAPATRSGSAPRVVEVTSGPAPASGVTPSPARDKRTLPTRPGFGIVAFDCACTEEGRAGETLRSWNLGGDNGASLNWVGDLSCPVQIRSDCDGTSMTTVFAGNAHVSRFDAVRADTVLDATLTIPEATWTAAQQDDPNGSYSTVRFEARVDMRCEQPDGGAIDTLHWTDSFIGGFAGGE